MHTEGETAGAGAAGAAGIPFTLSTLGTTSIEDVKLDNPIARNWSQLYVIRDRKISYEFARLRDTRNGLPIPPQLRLRTIVNAVPRPW